METLKSSKGIATFFTLMVLAVVLSIALSLGSFLVTELQISGDIGDSVLAFYAADAGIEKVLYDELAGVVNVIDVCGAGGCPGILSNGSEFNVVVQAIQGPCQASDFFCATSTGSFRNARRTIYIEF